MTAEMLSGMFGMVLSLVFAYVPKARDWYNKLSGDYKRLVMLGGLATIAVSIFAAACTPLAAELGIPYACTSEDALKLLKLFGAALIANQAMYPILPGRSQKAA